MWWENVLYLWGRRSNVFISLMWSVLCPVVIIFFIFILYLSSADGQGCLCYNGFVIAPQARCGWRYLIFYVLYHIYTKIFSFSKWCFISTFTRLYSCIGSSTEQKGVVCPIHLSRLGCGTEFQLGTIVEWVGTTEWVLLYICTSVHVSVNEWLIFVPLWNSNLFYLYLLLDFLCIVGSFAGVYSRLIKFGQEIHGSKGIHQNVFFIYFGGSNVWIIFIG